MISDPVEKFYNAVWENKFPYQLIFLLIIFTALILVGFILEASL